MELYVNFDAPIKKEPVQKIIDILSRAAEDENKIERIIIFFSSFGGDIHKGFLLASLIQNSKIPVAIHATNHIDSIANVVYLSAKERTAESYAKFYLHSASIEGSFNENQLVEQLTAIRIGNSRIAQFISENSNLSPNAVRGMMKGAQTLSAQEALKYEMVKEISHKRIPPDAHREEIIDNI